ncbi:hypothetical protein HK405_004909, partial [Cladochytrium tenue]
MVAIHSLPAAAAVAAAAAAALLVASPLTVAAEPLSDSIAGNNALLARRAAELHSSTFLAHVSNFGAGLADAAAAAAEHAQPEKAGAAKPVFAGLGSMKNSPKPPADVPIPAPTGVTSGDSDAKTAPEGEEGVLDGLGVMPKGLEASLEKDVASSFEAFGFDGFGRDASRYDTYAKSNSGNKSAKDKENAVPGPSSSKVDGFGRDIARYASVVPRPVQSGVSSANGNSGVRFGGIWGALNDQDSDPVDNITMEDLEDAKIQNDKEEIMDNIDPSFPRNHVNPKVGSSVDEAASKYRVSKTDLEYYESSKHLVSAKKSSATDQQPSQKGSSEGHSHGAGWAKAMVPLLGDFSEVKKALDTQSKLDAAGSEVQPGAAVKAMAPVLGSTGGSLLAEKGSSGDEPLKGAARAALAPVLGKPTAEDDNLRGAAAEALKPLFAAGATAKSPADSTAKVNSPPSEAHILKSAFSTVDEIKGDSDSEAHRLKSAFASVDEIKGDATPASAASAAAPLSAPAPALGGVAGWASKSFAPALANFEQLIRTADTTSPDSSSGSSGSSSSTNNTALYAALGTVAGLLVVGGAVGGFFYNKWRKVKVAVHGPEAFAGGNIMGTAAIGGNKGKDAAAAAAVASGGGGVDTDDQGERMVIVKQ